MTTDDDIVARLAAPGAEAVARPDRDDVSAGELPVVVVGGGPVGARIAEQLAMRGTSVLLFNAERRPSYNRVRLTPLLAGDASVEAITLGRNFPGSERIRWVDGLAVTGIDRAAREVVSADGRRWRYRTLVLATGSTAFVPPIPGHRRPGVLVFRTIDDVEAMLAGIGDTGSESGDGHDGESDADSGPRRVVVLGGGLLGLEAARGLQRRGAAVTVVETAGRLMPRQVDEEASRLLAGKLAAMGIELLVGVGVAAMAGGAADPTPDEAQPVSRVVLVDGRTLDCDLVVVCAGVRPETGLARAAGLDVGRGIRVDDAMASSDPDIFAVGECTEHADRLIGLVAPGLAQADAAAKAIAWKHARENAGPVSPDAGIAGDTGRPEGYVPPAEVTRLKLLGAEVFSAGQIDPDGRDPGAETLTWRDGETYRRLFLRDGRLAGLVAIGAWDELGGLQARLVGPKGDCKEIIASGDLRRFMRSGRLSAAAAGQDDTLCTCTGVGCAAVRSVIASGETSVAGISRATGAGTVCGGCVPRIEEMLDAGAPPKPIRFSRPLLLLSAVAGFAAAADLVLPRIPYAVRFGSDWRNWLWQDDIVGQWTGYGLLAVTMLAVLLGVRKRVRPLRRLGGYDAWRIVHLGLGFLAAVGLFLHTGFRPGENLNLVLFLAFSGSLVAGALAGAATGGDHLLRARGIGSAARPPRRLPGWIHILLLWPLPPLLLVHILMVYLF